MSRQKWYQTTWFLVLLCLVAPYIGIFFLMKRTKNKLILGGVAVWALIIIIGAFADKKEADKTLTANKAVQDSLDSRKKDEIIAKQAAEIEELKKIKEGQAATQSIATTQPAATPSAEVNKYISAKVTKIIDGDTIDVLIGDKKETVRFVLVDTPETKHPAKPIEPFGPEASKFTTDLLEGKEVKLEKDVSERDSYGRLLMYVWLDDRLVNELLLEKGLARVAIYQPDVKYVDKFREIQKQAQQAGTGIWSIENYANDDGYHPEVVKKAEEPVKEIQPSKVPASNSNVSYPNCTAVKAAGKAPLHRGDPGYSGKLDRDNDGVACE